MAAQQKAMGFRAVSKTSLRLYMSTWRKEKVLEKQLAMNESHIQESLAMQNAEVLPSRLCASLIKAESRNSQLEAGVA